VLTINIGKETNYLTSTIDVRRTEMDKKTTRGLSWNSSLVAIALYLFLDVILPRE
jgi:hypothetical protein